MHYLKISLVLAFLILMGCFAPQKNYHMSVYSDKASDIEKLMAVWSICSSCLEGGICVDTDTRERCINQTLPNRTKALNHAVGRANIKAIRYLIEVVGVDINDVSGDYGETPLHVISYYGAEVPLDYKTMKYLLDNGANVHARKTGGSYPTPLETAVWKNKKSAVQLLSQYGAFDNEDTVSRACSVALVHQRYSIVPLLPQCCEFVRGSTMQSYYNEELKLYCESPLSDTPEND